MSQSPLRLASGELRWLELSQNVSASLEQQRLGQMLLIAAAGVLILFTSLLLRPVLRRGLIVHLDDLDRQLQILEADNLGEHLLDLQPQPQKLRAIALAFNNLQLRLAEAWARDRNLVDGFAHKLRTPITVISSHVQRLQGQALPPSELRSTALISTEAKCMAALPALWADPVCVHECLQELIRNALQCSSGSVRLLAVEQDERLVLHVLDQGPGIEKSERSLVLQRFKRGTSSANTRGTGIGLALVDELMRAMDGELLISDAPAGGVDLQLRFRAAEASP